MPCCEQCRLLRLKVIKYLGNGMRDIIARDIYYGQETPPRTRKQVEDLLQRAIDGVEDGCGKCEP